MTRKHYRTAQGKTVDLGSLILQNENTRAVGNMKVNARGDLVDGWNRPIDSRTQQVQKQYDRQVGNVKDEPVAVSAKPAKAETASAAKPAKPARDTAPKRAIEPETEKSPETKVSSLADAIARARRISQETVKTPQQISQNEPGVKKI